MHVPTPSPVAVNPSLFSNALMICASRNPAAFFCFWYCLPIDCSFLLVLLPRCRAAFLLPRYRAAFLLHGGLALQGEYGIYKMKPSDFFGSFHI